MDIALAGSAITYRPNDDQLGGLNLQFVAFDGEVGIGQVPVPDPLAAISVYDGRALRVDEGDTLLTDGWIVDQDRTRGPMPAATARLHTFSVMDANAVLTGFRVRARSRGAETDYARVIAFAGLDLPDLDTTWVLNTETVTLPAKVYDADGGWTSELIPDLVEFTGKTLFVHDLADGSGRCLHYHNLTSGHGCGLEIDDTNTDTPRPGGGSSDGLTWNPQSPQRQRTSVDLWNDVLGVDQLGRTSSATDATSISRHDADGLLHQSLQRFESNSQADLDIQTSAFLASQRDERDTYTCTIGPLDEDQLALIRVGDIITVTSSVMGLTASNQRISHLTLKPVIGEGGRAAEGYWYADLELGAPVRRRRRIKPRPLIVDIAVPDEPWVCIPWDYRVRWSDDSESGLAYMSDAAGQHDSALSCTLYNGATYHVVYSVYHSALSNTLSTWIKPNSGPATPYGFEDLGGNCAGGPPVLFVATDITILDTRDYVVVLDAAAFVLCDSETSESRAAIYYVSGSDPRFSTFEGPCSNGEPRVGQQLLYSGPEGDGTTTDFTVDWPYLAGSIHLWVNGLDWTPQVNETDPAAGEYTLDYPVPTGADVIIRYRRAA